MADYTITDIVDAGALKQLDDLADKFITVKSNYSDLAAELGKQVSLPVGTYDELVNKVNAFVQAQTQMAQSQKEMTALLQQMQTAYSSLNQSTQNHINATRQQKVENVDAERVMKLKLKTGQELTEEERKMAVEMAKASQAAREQKREIENEAKAARAAADSYNALSAKYADMKIKLNAMNPNTQEWKSMAAEAKKIYDQMNAMQKETGNTSLNVGNYTKSIQEAIAGNGRFGQSVMSLTILLQNQGLAGALAGARTAMAAFGKALWALATNPYFLAITSALLAIKGLYEGVSFWAKYNEETAHAKRITGEFLDLSDEGLRVVFSRIKAIAETYGKEYKDVLDAVDTLTSQYEITAQEALDVVQKGFAAGADESGTMLSQIKNFAPAFRDAGVSAKQLVAFIQQTRSGIFNEEGMTAMQTAFKRLREMSSGAAKALDNIGISANEMKKNLSDGSLQMVDAVKQVSDKLKELPPNSQEVGAVLKDVFGKQGANTGLQLITTLGELTDSLEEVKKTTGEVGESQDKLVDATAEFDYALDKLFGMSEGGWETMKNNMKTVAYQIGTKLLKKLAELYNMFVDLWNASGKLRQGIGAVVIVAIGMQKALWTVFGVLLRFVTAVVKSIAAAGKVVWNFGKGVFDVLTFDFAGAKAAFGGLGDMVKVTFKTIGDAGHDLAKGIKTDVDDFVGYIKNGSAMIDALGKQSAELKKMDINGMTMDKSAGDTGGGGKKGGGGGDTGRTNAAGRAEKARQKGVTAAAKAAEAKRIADAKRAAAEKERIAKEHAKYMEKITAALGQTLIQLETDENERAIMEIRQKYAKLRAEIKKEGLTTEEAAQEALLEENYNLLENRELEQKLGTAAVQAMITKKYEEIRKELEKQGELTAEKQAEINADFQAELGGLVGATAVGGSGISSSGGKQVSIVGNIQRQFDDMFTKLLTAYDESTEEFARGTRQATENEITAFLDQYADEISKNPELAKVVDAWAASLRKATEEGLAESAADRVGKTMNFGALGIGQARAGITLSNDYNAEMSVLTDMYAKGLIQAEEYEKKKQQLTEEYESSTAQIALRVLREQLKVQELSDDKRLEIEQAIAEAELDITKKKNEKIEQENQTAEEKEKERIERIAEYMQQAGQMIQGIGSLVNTLFQNELDTLGKQSEELDAAYEAKAAKWDELEERGMMTTEEAENRKRRAKEQTQRKQDEIAKKQRELQIKQAKWEKAMSAVDTVINTAAGIMKVWNGEGTTSYKIAMTAFVAAQGAIQLATIMAQKIPEYAKGTDDHKGGFAIVGDAFKPEVVMTDKGTFITPSVPTLVDLPKHAKVLPDATDLLAKTGLMSDFAAMSKNGGNNVVVNVDNDYSRLEAQMTSNTREIKRLQRIIRSQGTNTQYLINYGRV